MQVVEQTFNLYSRLISEASAIGQPGLVERLTADQFGEKPVWTRAPLVMLNGCGTAGFSPDALSPFVTKLVRDRGAGGVIGTEILVDETLANEAAVTFLTAFFIHVAATG